MTRQIKYIYILFLYAINTLIAFYLVLNHYQLIQGAASSHYCNINSFFNCDAVNASPYSRFLGIPLAAWGLAAFLFCLLLSLHVFRKPQERSLSSNILKAATRLIFLIDIYLLGISLIKLKAICLYCSATYFNNFLILILILQKQSNKNHDNVNSLNFRREIIYIFGSLLMSLFLTGLLIFKLNRPTQFDEKYFLGQVNQNRKYQVTWMLHNSQKLGFISSSKRSLRVVTYLDTQCPFCSIQYQLFSQIMNIHRGEIEIFVKFSNLNESARAAICASRQGAFEIFLNYIFTQNTPHSHEKIIQWAKLSSFDMAQFEDCLRSDDPSLAIQKDIQILNEMGVTHVPAHFIGSRYFRGFINVANSNYMISNSW